MPDLSATDTIPKQRPRRERVAAWTPPVLPLAVLSGFLVMLTTVVVALDLSVRWLWIAIAEAVLVLLGWLGGWLFRRAIAGSDLVRRWQAWEDGLGLVVLVPIAVVVAGWSIWRLGNQQWGWLALAATLAAISVAAVATRRPSAEAPLIVLNATAPEPLADFQQVSLPWDLAPAQPTVTGEFSVWLRLTKLVEFRPPANPIATWVAGEAGQERPAWARVIVATWSAIALTSSQVPLRWWPRWRSCGLRISSARTHQAHWTHPRRAPPGQAVELSSEAGEGDTALQPPTAAVNWVDEGCCRQWTPFRN